MKQKVSADCKEVNITGLREEEERERLHSHKDPSQLLRLIPRFPPSITASVGIGLGTRQIPDHFSLLPRGLGMRFMFYLLSWSGSCGQCLDKTLHSVHHTSAKHREETYC